MNSADRPGSADVHQNHVEPIEGVPVRHLYSLRHLAVPGGTLAYGVWEPAEPASATIVAVHGITGNHRCWPFLAEQLPRVRVVAPDLRGRGGSAGVGKPFGMARHADDIAAVLDDLAVETTVLVGHSMGGYVALVTADRHPERVRSVVLVDGGLPVGGDSRAGLEVEVERITSSLAQRLAMTFPTVAAAVQFWRRHPAFEDAWTSVAEDYARYDLGGTPPDLRSRATTESMMADSLDVVDGTGLSRALKRLRHPTQWLVARYGLLNDVPPLYPVPAVVHWHERYPQIQIRPVSMVNHYTIVMSPRGGQEIASAVDAALH